MLSSYISRLYILHLTSLHLKSHIFISLHLDIFASRHPHISILLFPRPFILHDLHTVCFTQADVGAVAQRPCDLLVCAGPKQVERTTFDAINGNSLVYDGRLVVDTHFCTNDKAVYAAGVITKFSRRYRSHILRLTSYILHLYVCTS